MKKELVFVFILSLACPAAFAQSSGRDTTPPTDADITPQSSAPGSGGGAGSGPGGSGDSSTRTGDTHKSLIQKKFKLIDANGDGLISVDEAKSSDSLTQSFDQADKNKDSLLTLEEYRAVVDTGVGSSGAGEGMQTTPPASASPNSSGTDNTGGSDK